MADNVSISFGADTTGFLDGVARVSAALSKIDEAARACGASQQDVARTNLVAINGEIAAEQMAFAQKQSLYGQLTRLKLMTGEERVVAAKAALDAEYAAESALLQKEAQIEGLRPSQRQAVLGRMTLLDQKYAADSQRLMLQSVEQMVAPMNHMVDAMSASFSSSLTGMIMGTKNLQQAMRSLTQAVVSQFVRMGVEVVADWAKKQLAMAALSLAGEGQKTAAASAGAAARTGISAGEAAAGEATVFASILRNITASASETFAGVFGFLAPVMGPAAAAP
ncbi:hypothetical protein, partial [Rhodoblastus acidophilus]